ncbi:MAG: PASTA domain-containing protein [Acidimicrobiia bacterium]
MTPARPPSDADILSISEAAKECSLSRSTIRRFAARDRFPNAYRANGNGSGPWRIPRADLVAAGLIEGEGAGIPGGSGPTSPGPEKRAPLPLGPASDVEVVEVLHQLHARLHDIEVRVARLDQRADVNDTLTAGQARAIEELTVDMESLGRTRSRSPRRPRGSARSRWSLNITFLVIIAIVIGGLYVFTRLGDDTPPQATVPDLVDGNPPVGDVLDLPDEVGLDAVVQFTESPDTTVGSVLAQDPEAGARVDEGSDVTIVVSAGQGEVDVPDVIGESFDDAREQLWFNGLNVERNEDRIPSDEDVNTVARLDPEPGTTLDRAGTVTVFLSNGEAPEL